MAVSLLPRLPSTRIRHCLQYAKKRFKLSISAAFLPVAFPVCSGAKQAGIDNSLIQEALKLLEKVFSFDLKLQWSLDARLDFDRFLVGRNGCTAAVNLL